MGSVSLTLAVFLLSVYVTYNKIQLEWRELTGLLGFVNIGAKTAKRNLTCVFCRAKWVLAGAGAAGGGGAGAAGGGGAAAARGSRRTAEGYLNLGAVAGLSPVRDTSTCTFFLHSRFFFVLFWIWMAWTSLGVLNIEY